MDGYKFYICIVNYVMSSDEYKAHYDYYFSHYHYRDAYKLLQIYIALEVMKILFF